MNNDLINAIERVLDKRVENGASDKSLVDWLEGLKSIHNHTIDKTIDGFIDAIKQTHLKPKNVRVLSCGLTDDKEKGEI